MCVKVLNIFILIKNLIKGTSLVAQWIRLRAPNAGGPGFDPWSWN